MRKRRLQFDGKDVEVLDLDFEVQTEEWNVYKLLDGGTVRVKTTPLRIMRVLDDQGKPAYTVEGDPNIVVNHATHVVCREES
jgi:hypothetical protein